MTRVHRLAVAMAITMAVWALTLHAQTTPLFELDCGVAGAAYPECGWGGVYDTYDGDLVTRSFQAGVGPGGRDAVRFVMIPDNTPTSCNPNLGWFAPTGMSSPAQGGSRFYRYYIKYTGTNVSKACVGGDWGGKIILTGATGDDNQRIFEVAESVTTTWTTKLHQNTVQEDLVAGSYASGGYIAIQIQCKTSSTSSATDGEAHLWRNNDTQGSPDASVTGFLLNVATNNACGNFEFLTAMESVAVGDSLTIEVAAIEGDDAFDPNWFTNMGSGSPALVYRLRFRVADVLGMFHLRRLAA